MTAVCTQSSVPDLALALKAAWLGAARDGRSHDDAGRDRRPVAGGARSAGVRRDPRRGRGRDGARAEPDDAAARRAVPADRRDLRRQTGPRRQHDRRGARVPSSTQSLETLLRANHALSGYYNGPGALYHVKPEEPEAAPPCERPPRGGAHDRPRRPRPPVRRTPDEAHLHRPLRQGRRHPARRTPARSSRAAGRSRPPTSTPPRCSAARRVEACPKSKEERGTDGRS
jgi:hypothetical protein